MARMTTGGASGNAQAEVKSVEIQSPVMGAGALLEPVVGTEAASGSFGTCCRPAVGTRVTLGLSSRHRSPTSDFSRKGSDIKY